MPLQLVLFQRPQETSLGSGLMMAEAGDNGGQHGWARHWGLLHPDHDCGTCGVSTIMASMSWPHGNTFSSVFWVFHILFSILYTPSLRKDMLCAFPSSHACWILSTEFGSGLGTGHGNRNQSYWKITEICLLVIF